MMFAIQRNIRRADPRRDHVVGNVQDELILLALFGKRGAQAQ